MGRRLARGVVGWCGGWLMILGTTLHAVHGAPGWRPQADDPARPSPSGQALDPAVKRWEQVVYRRPTPGTAFDRWCELYLRSRSTADLMAHARRRAEEASDRFEPHLVWAMVLERWGDPREALVVVRRAQQVAPEQVEPLKLETRLLERIGDLPAAAERWQRLLKRPAVNPLQKLEWGERLGRLYLRMGRDAEALEVWRQIADPSIRQPRLLAQLAHLCREAGFDEEALRYWKQIAEQDEPSWQVTAHIERSELLLRTGQRELALRELEAAQALVDSSSWLAADILERTRRVLEDQPQAWSAWLQTQLKKSPHDLRLHRMYARQLSQTGLRQQALAHAIQTVRAMPDRADAQQWLARMHFESAQFQAGLDVVRQSLERSSTDMALHRESWELVDQFVDPQDRQAWLGLRDLGRRMLAIHPQEPETARWLIQRLAARVSDSSWQARQSELREEVLSLYHSWLRLQPRSLEAHLDFAEFLSRIQQKPQAIQRVRQGLEQLGYTPDAWEQVTRFYLRQAWHPEALEAARQLATRSEAGEESATATLQLLTEATWQAGEWDEAVRWARQWVRAAGVGPQAEAAWRSYESILTARGETEAYLQETLRKVAGQPVEAGEAWGIARMLRTRNRETEALRVLELALRQPPVAEGVARELRSLYAEMLNAAGQWGLAITQWERLLAESESSQRLRILTRLAQTLEDSGRPDEALKVLEQQAASLSGQPEFHRVRAELAQRLEKWSDAEQALRAVLSLVGHDVELRIQLAEVLSRQDRHGEARAQLWAELQHARQRSDLRSLGVALARMATTRTQRQQLLARLDELRFGALADQADWVRLEAFEFWHATGELETLLTRMLRRDPKDPQLLVAKVELLLGQQRTDEATIWQERLCQIDASPQHRNRLVDLYLRTGQAGRASSLLEDSVRDLTDLQDAVTQLDGYWRVRQEARALALLPALEQTFPNAWPIMLRAALLHLAQRNPNSAAKYLQAVLALPDQEPSDGLPRYVQWELRWREATGLRQWIRDNHSFGRRLPMPENVPADLDTAKAVAAIALQILQPESKEAARHASPTLLAPWGWALAMTLEHELFGKCIEQSQGTVAESLMNWLALKRVVSGIAADSWPTCLSRYERLVELNPSEPIGMHEIATVLLTEVDDAGYRTWLKSEIERVQSVQQWEALIPLLPWAWDRELVQAWGEQQPRLKSASGPEAGGPETGGPETGGIPYSLAVRTLLLWGEGFRDELGDQVALEMLERLGEASPPVGVQQWNARLGPLAMSRWLSFEGTDRRYQWLIQQQQALQKEIADPRLRGEVRFEIQKRLTRIQELRGYVREQAVPLEQSASDVFPTAFPGLEPSAFQAARHVFAELPIAERVALRGRLKATAEAANGSPIAAVLSAYGAWWMGERAEACRILDACARRTGAPEFRLLALRAWLHQGDLSRAMYQLNRLSPTKVDAGVLSALRAEIERRWSEQSQVIAPIQLSAAVPAARFDSRGSIWAVDLTGQLTQIRLEETKVVHTISTEQDMPLTLDVHDLADSRRGCHIALGGYDGRISLWKQGGEGVKRVARWAPSADPDSSETVESGPEQRPRVRQIVFAPGGESLAFATEGTVGVYRVSDGELLWQVAVGSRKLVALRFDQAGRNLLCVDEGGQIRVRNAQDGAQVFRVQMAADTAIGGDWLDEQVFVVVGRNHKLQAYRIGQSAAVADWDLNFAPRCMELDARRGILLIAGDDYAIRQWKWPDPRIQYEYRGHTGTVTSLDFDAFVSRFSSTSRDGTVRVWSLEAYDRKMEAQKQ